MQISKRVYRKNKNILNNVLNESISPDEKFTREINALFKQQDVIDFMQKAYNDMDEAGKQAFLDATEEEFLNKYAKEGGSGSDDKDKKDKEKKSDSNSKPDDWFEEDGSDLDTGSDEDFDYEGSDSEGSDNENSNDLFSNSETSSSSSDFDNSNPFM